MLKKSPIVAGLISIIGLMSTLGCTRLSETKEALGVLVEFSANDKDKQSASKEETLNFGKVKRHIGGGKAEAGLSIEEALERFGEPVVVIYEAQGQKWGYKPAQSTWFHGERIYLFFGADNKLTGWEEVK